MYHAKYVIPGILIFIGLFTAPIWYNLASAIIFGNKVSAAPELVIDPKYTKCVESKEYMLANHMDLLNTWRDSVVRDGNRVYIASDGTKYNMSLTKTCHQCHYNKAEFCDRCHTYQAVDPVCWNCHLEGGTR